MGTGSWGAQPSTDKVLARLVEREAGWGELIIEITEILS
jgi:hypothetical protein